eukprot:424255_1
MALYEEDTPGNCYSADDEKQSSQLMSRWRCCCCGLINANKQDKCKACFTSNPNPSASGVEIKDTLTATNGKTVKASIVFVAVFKHLHKQAKNYLKRNKLSRSFFKSLTDKDYQWIITVPAIWNDASKYKMRQWAIDARLVDPNIEGQCKIVYEPDCASLALQYETERGDEPLETP